MIRHAFVILGLLVCTGCGRDGPLLTDTPISEISGLLDRRVPGLMAEHDIVGLSVAVIRQGEISVSKSFGYRDIESKQVVNENTVYKAASLGKPIFAYIVVKLAQQGMLDLDKPLYSYSGNLVVENDPRSHKVTARMLLSHSAGLANLGDDPVEAGFHFDPGTGFKYSGYGYLHLQKVVEAITGKSLGELADEIVFRPLKMKNSSYRWREKYRHHISRSYDSDRKKYAVKKEALVGYSAWSLYTTPEDYSTFVAHIIGTAKDPDSVSARLLRPHRDVAQGVKWGLGWGLQDTSPHQSFWHWGSMAGFRHYVVGYPKEKIAIIVMSNSSKAFKMVDDVMAVSIGGSYPSYDWF